MALFISLLALGIVILAVIFFTSTLISTLRFGIPYVPSGTKTIRKMHEMVNLKPGETIYDLGCGDATILRKLPKDTYNLIGIEGDTCVTILARLLCLRRKDITLKNQNFLKHDYADADVLLLYISPHGMADIEKVVWPQLKKGARVVSNTFSFPNIEPETTEILGRVKVRLYVKK